MPGSDTEQPELVVQAVVAPALSPGLLGNLHPFDASKDKWQSYKYRYLAWIDAVATLTHGFTDGTKIMLLRARLGDAHEVLRTRLGGDQLGEDELRKATHDEILKEHDKHYDPPQSKYARRL